MKNSRMNHQSITAQIRGNLFGGCNFQISGRCVGSVNGSANIFYHWYEFNCAVICIYYCMQFWVGMTHPVGSPVRKRTHTSGRVQENDKLAIIAYTTKENTIALSNYVEVISNTVFDSKGMAWWKIALRNIVTAFKNHVAYTLTKSCCGFRV